MDPITTSRPTAFTDLPLDVLLLIAPYLAIEDFLALTSTCRLFYSDAELRFSAAYWSVLARRTFRVPNQPVAQADGQRWMRLYRRMRTQSRIYAWGSNDGACMGGARVVATHFNPPFAGRRGRPHLTTVTRPDPDFHAWPRQLSTASVGVVADLQCGGYSIVMLNSHGRLFANGRLSDSFRRGATLEQPCLLTYPQGFPKVQEALDARTAIDQFSTGRTHVLGLSDSGRIWSWDNVEQHALAVKFLAIDTYEHVATDAPGRVTKVVAGFDASSAYIQGKGIVIWEPIDNNNYISQQEEASDTVLVADFWVVPGTSFSRDGSASKRHGGQNDTPDSQLGEVQNWILLEGMVLFITDLGRVFAVTFPNDEQPLPERFEVHTGSSAQAVDVQGAFHRFAIPLRDDTVVTGDRDILSQMRALEPEAASRLLSRIPSLQHTGVISLTFGDHHYHALHADGTISSHGIESQFKGAFGLGSGSVGLVRGMAAAPDARFDGRLLPECETTGRRVHFEQAKHQWLMKLRGSADTDMERFRAVSERAAVRAPISEWVEQRLRAWDDIQGPEGSTDDSKTKDDEDDGLPTYFALSVAAAGWHSGAIVLVNDKKTKRAARQAQAQAAAQEEAGPAGTADDEAQQPRENAGMLASVRSGLTSVAQWLPGSPDARADIKRLPAEPCHACMLAEAWCSLETPSCEHCAALPEKPRCVYPAPAPWWNEVLPRLRLPGGEVLPGDDEVLDWTCPAFSS